MRYGILIANWNGSEFIERCLASVLAAARRIGEDATVMIVDDASTDDSPKQIASLFPSVTLFALGKNVGFGRAVNAGMNALEVEKVFLLNNDLALPVDYFERLIECFDSLDSNARESVFAIGAKTLQWETHEPNHAGMRARWNGRMIVQEGFESAEAAPADFVQGGSCLIDRKKFLALGGFCEIFYPGYWEDYDVCYQALKRGWKIFYEPRAVAYHWGRKSMRRLLGDHQLAVTILKNHLLFNWINLDDPRLLRRHVLELGPLMLEERNDEIGNLAGWPKPFIGAIQKLPQALAIRRQRQMEKLPVSDREILKL